MTFSLIAHDPTSGAVGMVVTSSSPCVAARCIHLRSGVGAAASQNVTDPQLGQKLLDALENGSTPEEAIQKVTNGTPHIEYRQLTVVDTRGRTAHFSGAGTLGTHNVVEGEHAVAAGNLLSTVTVPEAMMRAFNECSSDFLEEKLLAGIRAGLDAGGEEGPVHSVGIKVLEEYPWAVTDLRVDWHETDPIGALEELWEQWKTEKAAYKTRAVDPTDAPSYGVPGDE
ncbi:DUF1028 domain-containing protein [Micrococcoides hystricis]|uniref:DUF1028 domain-containing protein n=1 Tax=Micrococcoides hystricis TaxID=1572761 RepID=A0ABV6P9T7_9MICC